MIETLFYACYYAYLLGNLEETRLSYELLKEEFKISGSQISLSAGQFKELRKIKQSLETGMIAHKKWLDEPLPADCGQKEENDLQQKDLVKIIDDCGRVSLENLVQDELYLYNIEHPCPPYGFVDMVYMGRGTIYPVEVKKDQGKHDLIGQIYKYDLHMKLKLHYKFYTQVKSITICQTYQPMVINELKQMEILPILYVLGEKKIFLRGA